MPELNFTAATVKPCIKCGAADRLASGACRACAKKNAAAYYVENKAKIGLAKAAYRLRTIDHFKATQLAWRTANAVSFKAYQAAWLVENKERAKASQAEWYQANKEHVKARGAARYKAKPEMHKAATTAWAKANPERIKACRDAYAVANKDSIRAGIIAWHAAHPEAARIHNQNRRAQKLATGGKLSKGLVLKLFALQRGLCPCCAKPLGDDYHLDHIQPLKSGGAHADANMQLLRAACNLNKSAKDPLAFMQSRGFLL